MRSTPASTRTKRRRARRHHRPDRQGRADGTLRWTPPGNLEDPAPRLVADRHRKPSGHAEATGLEVDKYDGKAVRAYLETYLSKYERRAGKDLVGARGVRAMVTDSIEVGSSNWTPRLLEQFKAPARLRCAALAAGPDRRRHRQPRPHRRLPVRLPPHPGRPDGERALWHRGGGRARARA
jgi:hypothetical protein